MEILTYSFVSGKTSQLEQVKCLVLYGRQRRTNLPENSILSFSLCLLIIICPKTYKNNLNFINTNKYMAIHGNWIVGFRTCFRSRTPLWRQECKILARVEQVYEISVGVKDQGRIILDLSFNSFLRSTLSYLLGSSGDLVRHGSYFDKPLIPPKRIKERCD